MSVSLKELRRANTNRGIEWMGGPNTMDDLLFNTTELGGECGEALNAVKKLHRFMHGRKGGVPLDESKQAIAEELADVIICCDRVAEPLQIDLADALVNKFNKTSDKYGLTVRLTPGLSAALKKEMQYHLRERRDQGHFDCTDEDWQQIKAFLS